MLRDITDIASIVLGFSFLGVMLYIAILLGKK